MSLRIPRMGAIGLIVAFAAAIALFLFFMSRFGGPSVRLSSPYEVSALVSQDRRSVLLRRQGETGGWSFRNDALEIAVEPSRHVSGRPCQQMVLRGQRRADSGARVRWKLSAAGTSQDGSHGDESHIDAEVARA